MRNEGLDGVCAGSVVPAAMSGVSCCNCFFQDTQFLTGSCGASFALFMGLVEYLVRSQDDIADPCNRPGRDSVKVSVIRILFIRIYQLTSRFKMFHECSVSSTRINSNKHEDESVQTTTVFPTISNSPYKMTPLIHTMLNNVSG
jgi:hypothetical protein